MVDFKEIVVIFLISIPYLFMVPILGVVMATFWESGYTCDAISIGDVFKKFGHVCDSDLNKAVTYSLIKYAGPELKPIKLCEDDLTKWLLNLNKKKDDKKKKTDA